MLGAGAPALGLGAGISIRAPAGLPSLGFILGRGFESLAWDEIVGAGAVWSRGLEQMILRSLLALIAYDATLNAARHPRCLGELGSGMGQSGCVTELVWGWRFAAPPPREHLDPVVDKRSRRRLALAGTAP